VNRIRILLVAAFVAFAALGACSGSSESDGGGGDEPSAGESGTSGAGASGQGGSSGSAGAATGGRGGSVPTGGSATGGSGDGGTVAGGTSGNSSGGNAGNSNGGGSGASGEGGSGGSGEGGSAGGGAGGGGGRECETADDCVLLQDCCSCMGAPEGATLPYCNLVCIQSRCQASQIGTDEVTCSFGRCVIDRSCNRSAVTCTEAPMPCPNGEVRSVREGCFGPCLPPTECRDVTACSDCGDDVCVIEEPQIPRTGCVRPPDSCTKGDYCDCLDACPPSGFVCMEEDDAVHCPCPVC
jgi:hypothetical protein